MVLEAACGLKYRDFLIVALTCRKPDIFPDNWIYIHSADVRVGRIQNFRNWSPDIQRGRHKFLISNHANHAFESSKRKNWPRILTHWVWCRSEGA